MDSQRLCAYNQTRECFLGLEVAAADLSYAGLRDLLGKLVLKSGEGLWMMPFRGIPESNLRAPLDLIYLDEDCLAIDVVESFPTFRVPTSSPPAASVLALPAHSIYSSQTQPGDQLVLCVAEEMRNHLERFSQANRVAGSVQSAVVLRGKPLWSGGPGVVELEEHSTEERPKTQKPYEMTLLEPGMKNVKPPRNWLERWWSPDPRKAPEPAKPSDQRSGLREQTPGLAAYYWNGASPKAHGVRDISSSGLYVLTEERWYPGTLILMTLQDPGDEQKSIERAVSVHSRAVRWGNDGVGLQFIPQEPATAQSGSNPLVKGADRAELDRFLKRFLKENE
jgi:hypothetical protein